MHPLVAVLLGVCCYAAFTQVVLDILLLTDCETRRRWRRRCLVVYVEALVAWYFMLLGCSAKRTSLGVSLCVWLALLVWWAATYSVVMTVTFVVLTFLVPSGTLWYCLGHTWPGMGEE